MRAPANAVNGPLRAPRRVGGGEFIEPGVEIAINGDGAFGHIVTQGEVSRVDKHAPCAPLTFEVQHPAQFELVQNVV